MKYIKYIVGVLVLFGAGYIVGHFFFQSAPVLGSPAGTTFNVAKFAGVAINLASPGANATSSSVLNTDAGARYVSAWKVGCTGVGTSYTAYTGANLASLQVTVGTTTTASPAVIPSQSLVANAVAVATTSTTLLVASSTLLTGSEYSALWPAGTYETFWFNATNTAACTVGVDYFGS